MPRGAGLTTTLLRHYFFSLTFPTARRSASYDSPTASYYYVRSRLRAAGAGGWAPRQRRGRAHGPVLGRRPVPALGQLATSAPRLCLQRRAGPRDRQGSPPTSRAPRARGATHCGRCATKCCAVAFQRPPDLRAEHQQLLPSSGYVLCLRPRPLAQPRPLPLCMDAGALSS